MFGLSFDTDWAMDSMIDDTLNLLNEYNVKSTFFITNKINFNKLKNHELAIHPNLNSIIDQEKILEESIQILPSKETKGCRCHRLFHNSSLMKSYEKLGIEYDSNYYMPYEKNIQPFLFEWTDVLEIPIYASDIGYFYKNTKFNLDKFDLSDVGVKIFLFHPFHIFMNTSSNEHYEKLRPFFNDEEYLFSNRKLSTNGTRTLFIQLLEHLEKNHLESFRMDQINKIYRMKNSQK